MESTVSVTEVAEAGEDHGDALFVGGRDDFRVAHRAAGLDHRGGAGFASTSRPSRNGKKASDATTEPGIARPAFSALIAAMRAESTRLIWPAPTPMVWRPSLWQVDDGVGLDVLGDAPGKEHVGNLSLRWGRAW